MAERTCSVPGCDRPSRKRGWCQGHYSRWLKSGDVRPDEPLTMRGAAVADRFWSKVDRTEGCWIWTARRDRDGYGRFSERHDRTVAAHRWSYEDAKGPIPDGLVLDHLCRNRACVRPDHLEAVTSAENTMRGESLPAENAALTSCRRGHHFTPENTYVFPDGRRGCRTCQRDAGREWKRQRRAEQRQARLDGT